MLVVLAVLHIEPSHTCCDLVLAGIQATAADIGDGAAVAVLGLGCYCSVLLKAQVRQSLLGPLAKGLTTLRCINAAQADFDLLIGSRFTTARSEGDAVLDADDKANGGS